MLVLHITALVGCGVWAYHELFGYKNWEGDNVQDS